MLENSAILRMATTNSGYMCGIQRVKPVSWPEGGRAGGSWGTMGVPAPAGSRLAPPGSSTTPRNWHLGREANGGPGQVAPEALGDLIHVRD